MKYLILAALLAATQTLTTLAQTTAEMKNNDDNAADTTSVIAEKPDSVNLNAIDSLYNKELAGVEVVANKPLIKVDLDKIGYSVEDDPDAKSSSVIEMLRKVPLVTVDGNDKIQVNGSGSFKVFVNGKPNNMMSNNPSEVLKSMPASSVKRIEVITDPGAKYDAEGMNAIINIVTIGRGAEGYTATISANANNRNSGGSAFATVKQGIMTLSGNYSYSKDARIDVDMNAERLITDETPSAGMSNTTTQNHYRIGGDHQWGSLETSFEIDSLRLLTAEFSFYRHINEEPVIGSVSGTAPATGRPLYGYSLSSDSRTRHSGLDIGLNYQRSFSLKDRLLTLSYKMSSSPRNIKSATTYDDITADDDWMGFVSSFRDQQSESRKNTDEHTFQVDYTTPIGKKHTVEAGLKYIIRDNKAENDRLTRAAESTDDYEMDNDRSVYYRHDNDIAAAYLGYRIKTGRLTGRLGARYEHTSQKVTYLLGQGDNFHKSLDDFVPSLSIGYKISDSKSLKASYNASIYRPNIYFLNPYLNDNDPTAISRGNPNLDSEKSHRLSLGYNDMTSKLSLSFNATYQFTNNSIEEVTRLVNDRDIAGVRNPTGKDVFYTSYDNIGKTRNAYLNAFVNWNITTTTRLYSNLRGGWRYMSDGMELNNKGWVGLAYAGLQQTLPKDWIISIFLYGSTPDITPQGKNPSYTQHNLSVNKSLLNKRLNVSVFAVNMFKRHLYLRSESEGVGFKQTSCIRHDNLFFGLSASLRFGELKAGVRKAERGIDNDDVKDGGNKDKK